MFITFEGIDGCGKSTQLILLKETLEQKGFKVITLREPGGTQLSEQIRDILLSNKSQINDISELLLFQAARANLVENIIKPALENDIFVLCDRFYDSTTAYQGYGRMIDLDIVKTCNIIAVNGLKPDLTFYLKLPLDVAKERSHKRDLDRIENAGDSFYKRVLLGYELIAREEPERIKIICSNGTIENTKNEILKNIPILNQ